MAAAPTDHWPAGSGWVVRAEIRWLALLRLSPPTRPVLQSRHGKDLTRYFPAIAAAIGAAVAPDTVLYGELVIWANERTISALYAAGPAPDPGPQYPAHLVVFDVVELPTIGSVSNRPFAERRARSKHTYQRNQPRFAMCPQTDSRAIADEWRRLAVRGRRLPE